MGKDTRLVSDISKDTQIVIQILYLDTGTVRGYKDTGLHIRAVQPIRDKVYPPWEKGYFPCIINYK